MRHIANNKGIDTISVDSAGTAGYHIGKCPDPRMTTELKRRGVPVSGTAQQFIAKHFDQFDLIIPMDLSNKKNVLKLAKTIKAQEKVKPFMSFCSQHSNSEVPDPYYDGEDAFSHVADIMEDGCEGIMNHLTSIGVLD